MNIYHMVKLSYFDYAGVVWPMGDVNVEALLKTTTIANKEITVNRATTTTKQASKTTTVIPSKTTTVASKYVATVAAKEQTTTKQLSKTTTATPSKTTAVASRDVISKV
ncbi:uncharacterized protein LOC122260775 [Penaeus japonicus]|uniref:uncharacterized protein LOC122260775 n=1 Tax=Penaeus japonicus TaxID=27405 RepID=UPI001C7153EA|nr:uncharacterized protein LOC122260775 [Penaeus japonicus]